MKSADLRDRDDSPSRWRLHFAWLGAVAVEGLMWARGVVVREVGAQQAAEMPFVEHDDAIEAFPSNRPDDALGKPELFTERLHGTTLLKERRWS
jgi:hypothetical protein